MIEEDAITLCAHLVGKMQEDIASTWHLEMWREIKHPERDNYNEHQLKHHNLGFPEYLFLTKMWMHLQEVRLLLEGKRVLDH